MLNILAVHSVVKQSMPTVESVLINIKIINAFEATFYSLFLPN